MPKSTKKGSKKFSPERWLKLGLTLAIVIVLNVFFNVGLDTFYDQPEWDDYCGSEYKAVRPLTDVESCDAYGGTWTYDEYGDYCDTHKEDCSAEYNQARSDYNRIAFVVLTILGTLSVIFAVFTTVPMSVAHGFMYGGLMSLLIGSARYWNDMDDYLQFIISGVALALLILVGVKKLKD